MKQMMIKNKISEKISGADIKSRILIPLIVFAILLISTSYVSAYQKLCLGYGEGIPDDDYVCWHTLCMVCVTDAFNPTHPGNCNDINGCSVLDGGGNVDGNPPELTINGPIEGNVYSGRKVLFDITSNEPASFYYIDNINGRGRWKKIASNKHELLKKVSFKDGFNDITIKAMDRNHNEVTYDYTFYVDSKKPKLKRSYPKKGFSSGDFGVEFVEENPVDLILHYGVIGAMRTKIVDIATDCIDGGKGYSCDTSVDLADFDGQSINYYFELTDIAGSTDTGDSTLLGVDITSPVINDLQFEKDGKKVYFTIDIDEAFLEEVYYSYEDRGRIKEKKLCSKLENGICNGKASFKDGNWDINVVVLDEAGNSVSQPLSFLIDSKVPKIKKTYPKKGFSSGDFRVEFVESDPVSSTLYFGGIDGTLWESSVDLGECNVDGDKYDCEVSVDLADFYGQAIAYFFSVEDVAGNVVVSKPIGLIVDITPPVLLNPDTFWEQGLDKNNKNIYFDFEIDELNLEEVSYIDWNDSRPKWKKLCSRLDSDGHCIKKKSFKKGMHDVDVSIMDEAGNAVGFSLDEFEVI
jgi:hypothetical protein